MFPESLKIAKVIPVFKADDPTLFSNYRPISIPPAFSKLFEKVMYNRLINFLNLNNILYSKQFGSRNSHSTALALIDLINNISSAIDRNETTLDILDLSKVLDTITHGILCQKLQHHGIRDRYCFGVDQKLSLGSDSICPGWVPSILSVENFMWRPAGLNSWPSFVYY